MVQIGELGFELDRSSAVTLPEQVVRAVRQRIVDGVLVAGDRLPGTRQLASAVGVSRGTVEIAYEQLTVQGYAEQRARSGTFVHPELPAAVRRPPASDNRVVPTTRTTPRPVVKLDLRPGRGGSSPTSEPAFRAAWRKALDGGHRAPEPLGEPELRSAVAEHLRVLRGTPVDPADVVVTGGSRDGVHLVLAAIGADAVAVEEPGFPGLRRALGNVVTVPVPVRDDGELVDALEAALLPGGGECAAVPALLVSPNHQFPHGTAMSGARRAELCAWAAARGVLLLEDDYDSEARYLTPAVAPLFDIAAPGTAVHIGTFSTVLTREVGTGYVVAQGDVAQQVGAFRERLGPAVPPLLQRALAEYMTSGGLRARITRARRRVREAARVVADHADLPGLVSAGHTVVVEADAAATRRMHAALQARGVVAGNLADGWTGPARRHGLVIAPSQATPQQLRRVLEVIASVTK